MVTGFGGRSCSRSNKKDSIFGGSGIDNPSGLAVHLSCSSVSVRLHTARPNGAMSIPKAFLLLEHQVLQLLAQREHEVEDAHGMLVSRDTLQMAFDTGEETFVEAL